MRARNSYSNCVIILFIQLPPIEAVVVVKVVTAAVFFAIEVEFIAVIAVVIIDVVFGVGVAEVVIEISVINGMSNFNLTFIKYYLALLYIYDFPQIRTRKSAGSIIKANLAFAARPTVSTISL